MSSTIAQKAARWSLFSGAMLWISAVGCSWNNQGTSLDDGLSPVDANAASAQPDSSLDTHLPPVAPDSNSGRADSPPEDTLLPPETPPAPGSAGGSFSVLTYNVAGLPAVFSSGNPVENTGTIGRLINDFHVVHVQEDFHYHADLMEFSLHPHVSSTSGTVPIGDGLNTMSSFPFTDFQRIRWDDCNGTDCLTPKGFTVARHTLAPGATVHFYNAHTNAGGGGENLAARRSNIAQLGGFIEAFSADHAVVVMGDLNCRYTRSGDNIRELTALGLTDVWVELVRGGVEPAQGSTALVCDNSIPYADPQCEIVDKVFYRGTAFLELTPTVFSYEEKKFRDENNQMLSDHRPIHVRFDWRITRGVATSVLAPVE